MNDADKLISLGMPHELAKRVADLGGGGEVDELRQEVNDLSVSLAATSSRANEALDKANAAAVVPVIRYGGSVAEADQVSAVNNVTMA